jgi:hypothetical protein
MQPPLTVLKEIATRWYQYQARDWIVSGQIIRVTATLAGAVRGTLVICAVLALKGGATVTRRTESARSVKI